MLSKEYITGQIGEAESKTIATRQLLAFLSVPNELENFVDLSSASILFEIDKMPEGTFSEESVQFQWTPKDIFDINGLLLFRDQFLKLDSGNEIRIRTAANTLLRSPVWSIRAGSSLSWDNLIDHTVSVLKRDTESSLIPVVLPGEIRPRLICYSYPKMGILCVNQFGSVFVIDIGDASRQPIDQEWENFFPESTATIWTPFDEINSASIGQVKSIWDHNLSILLKIEQSPFTISEFIFKENNLSEELMVHPPIVTEPQQTNAYCAAATARMILKHHQLDETQVRIAQAMRTGSTGATPKNQELGIFELTAGLLKAQTDYTPSFEEAMAEIKKNLPFKSALPGHARVCSGYKIDRLGKKFIHVNDPWPPHPGAGDTYFEDASAISYINQMYVRPISQS